MLYGRLKITYKDPKANTAITPIFRALLSFNSNICFPDQLIPVFNETLMIEMQLRHTIGIGMTMTMKSMMKSDSANPFSNGIVAMHSVRKVSMEIHQAAKCPLQAKRKARKNAIVQSITSTTISKLVIPNAVDTLMLVKKIRR